MIKSKLIIKNTMNVYSAVNNRWLVNVTEFRYKQHLIDLVCVCLMCAN